MAITGRAVLLAALGVVAVVLVPTRTTVWLWVLVVLLAVAADVLLAPRTATLRARRSDTGALRLTETGVTRLHLSNTGTRRVRGVARDAWQPSAGAHEDRHRLDLRPGESTELDTPLTPLRRGDLVTDRVTVRLPGPLGLAARQGSLRAPGVLRVLPAFPSRRHLPGLLAELRSLDGRAAVRTRGQGTEFDSLRDYVPGDDVRSIDWRATARRTSVVVRTWRPERDRQLVLLLDTSRTSAGRIGDVPRLDAAMDAALLLSALALKAGDRVDLVAGDRDVRTVSVGGRGASARQGRLHELIAAMAPLEPSLLEADWSRLASRALDLVHGSALVVVLTPLEPVVVEETLLPALTALGARNRVVLASVADPTLELMADPDAAPGPTSTGSTAAGSTAAGSTADDDGYTAAAAEHTLARRRHTATVLSGLGVSVLDRGPDDLPVDLTHLYLDLKSRGRL